MAFDSWGAALNEIAEGRATSEYCTGEDDASDAESDVGTHDLGWAAALASVEAGSAGSVGASSSGEEPSSILARLLGVSNVVARSFDTLPRGGQLEQLGVWSRRTLDGDLDTTSVAISDYFLSRKRHVWSLVA